MREQGNASCGRRPYDALSVGAAFREAPVQSSCWRVLYMEFGRGRVNAGYEECSVKAVQEPGLCNLFNIILLFMMAPSAMT
jgi:hypothetical protein